MTLFIAAESRIQIYRQTEQGDDDGEIDGGGGHRACYICNNSGGVSWENRDILYFS